MQARRRIVKVAVVGSGLAGLTAAYRLVKGSEHREIHVEVHLFEKVCIKFIAFDPGICVPTQHMLGSSHNFRRRLFLPLRSRLCLLGGQF